MARNDTIQKENRKALPKFLLTVLGCALLGGVLGFMSAMFAAEDILEGAARLLSAVCPWGIPVSSVALLGAAFVLYRRSAAQYAAWDADDEEDETMDAIERQLSYALLFTSLAMLAGMFFLAASFLCENPLVNVGLFCVSLAAMTLLQQKIVDLTRRMNPEKKGSIYDLKFRKHWLDSCDEAERAQIGQAAYSAFTAGNIACGVVWAVLVMLNIFADTGLLAVAAVLAVWGVLQVSYTITCIRLSRRRPSAPDGNRTGSNP